MGARGAGAAGVMDACQALEEYGIDRLAFISDVVFACITDGYHTSP